MKFVKDRIPFGSGRSLAEIIKENMQKKASAEEVVKTAAVKTAEADEAPSSGQPEAEAKLVNIPEKDAPSSGGKSCNEEAPSSGQPEAEAKLTNDPKVEAKTEEDVKEAEATEETKEAGTCEKCKKPCNACECDGECECKPCIASREVEVKEASTKFVKVANLDTKSKAWLEKYWRTLYPSDYVDAMLTDK